MKPRKVADNEFWITNISNRDVMLSDLGLSIKRGESRNLLDSKHYTYTKDHLQKSLESGSLHKKSNIIKVREVVPAMIRTIAEVHTEPLTSFRKAIPNIKEISFIDHSKELYDLESDDREEVKRIQERFAESVSEFDVYDRIPSGLVVDPSLKKNQ